MKIAELYNIIGRSFPSNSTVLECVIVVEREGVSERLKITTSKSDGDEARSSSTDGMKHPVESL